MANFKDIKGGDPEGLQNHNKKKPEAKSKPSSEEIEAKMRRIKAKEPRYYERDSFRFNPILSDLEKALIGQYSLTLMLEDILEDILEDEIVDREDLKCAWTLSGDLREMLHNTLQIELRYFFTIEELLSLTAWLKKKEEEERDAE